MKVEYFVIRDVRLNGKARSDEELADDPALRAEVLRHRYCVTSVCAAPGAGKVYCGCTNTGGDILHEFDVKTSKFRSLNFTSVAEPCDAKIHRGLCLDPIRRSLVFGIATLTPTSKVVLSRGARIMRFDLATETYHELCRPMPGNYIQAAIYDPQRQMAYSFTEPSQGFAVSDLTAGRTRWAMALGSIVHTSAIDPEGGVWGTWGFRGEHPFFRYDPAADSFDFREDLAMPTSRQASNVIYLGAGPVDCILIGPDGFLYVTSAFSELYRLDCASRRLEYLGRPVPHNRTPGLAFAPDGLLYGVSGDHWHVTLWSYNCKSSVFKLIGELAAPDGRRCFRPHDMTYMDGRFWIGETDNPKASGALWSVTV